MADTLPNIPLPRGVPVDLYDYLGVETGTLLVVQNAGSSELRLSSQAIAPTDSEGFYILPRSEEAINEYGDSGAWALSLSIDGLLNVRII